MCTLAADAGRAPRWEGGRRAPDGGGNTAAAAVPTAVKCRLARALSGYGDCPWPMRLELPTFVTPPPSQFRSANRANDGLVYRYGLMVESYGPWHIVGSSARLCG